jgi:hypothetical protein
MIIQHFIWIDEAILAPGSIKVFHLGPGRLNAKDQLNAKFDRGRV